MENFNKDMPVVILCGGLGTRLKEETEYKPKPMVNVGGRPILWHIMKIYKAYGFNNFILCLGYKSHVIKQYFLNYRWLTSDFKINDGGGLQICKNGCEEDNFNITFAETGDGALTGERLKLVEKYINTDEFMVTYGDGVSNVDIKKLIRFHKVQGTIGTLTGVHPTSKYGLVTTDENNLITNFSQKPRLNEYVNGGFMVFKREFLNYVKPGRTIEEALEDIVLKGQLSVYSHDDFWQAMDTYKDFEILNKAWEEDPKWKIW